MMHSLQSRRHSDRIDIWVTCWMLPKESSNFNFMIYSGSRYLSTYGSIFGTLYGTMYYRPRCSSFTTGLSNYAPIKVTQSCPLRVSDPSCPPTHPFFFIFITLSNQRFGIHLAIFTFLRPPADILQIFRIDRHWSGELQIRQQGNFISFQVRSHRLCSRLNHQNLNFQLVLLWLDPRILLGTQRSLKDCFRFLT